MANGHRAEGNIPEEDLPENNLHLFEGLRAAAQEYNLPQEDDPTNILQHILAYVFPRGPFIELLEQRGFRDIDLQAEGEQALTYNLQMTTARAGLTVPDLRQQLVQTVSQIPANSGVTWRAVGSVALIDGQTVNAQFVVAFLEPHR
jgi:hypothetical protein